MPDNKSYSNVFRIKRIETDTIVKLSSITIDTTYYWYKQGGHLPLLRIYHCSNSSKICTIYGDKSNKRFTEIADINKVPDFSIYPNPSKGQFQILNLKFLPERIEVYTIYGEKIFQQQNVNGINLCDSPKGIYFVKITDTKMNFYTKKIVIQ